MSGIFNPPHASHYGGVWERQIGTIRHILNDMLLELGARQLTHELLVTTMSEVAAIPSDIDEPLCTSQWKAPHPHTRGIAGH